MALIDVSIVIPTFNRCAFVKQAVDSALKQSGLSVEIIVVDDGSTDETPRVLERIPGIRYLRQEHRGASCARNRALREVRGEFVKFLDSDDELLPNTLASHVKSMREKSLDLLFLDWIENVSRQDKRCFSVVKKNAWGKYPDFPNGFLKKFPGPPLSWLIRRSALKELRWNEALPCYQDYEFLFGLMVGGLRIGYRPEIAGIYHAHKTPPRIALLDEELKGLVRNKVLDGFVVRLQAANKLSETTKQALATHYWLTARRFYRRTEKRDFEEVLSKIHRLTPNFIPLEGSLFVRWAVRFLGIPKSERLFAVIRSITPIRLRRLIGRWTTIAA